MPKRPVRGGIAPDFELADSTVSLPFPILCDTERRVITEWELLNPRERGGIAKPSAFVIDPGLKVRYASIDAVVNRVGAAEILSILEISREISQNQRKTYVPLLRDWIRAIRNNFRKD